jgi:hypothetical protein
VTSQETHTQHIVDPDVPDTEVILVAQPAPVFVDSTGRRRRLLRRLAYGFGAFCMVYGGLISLSLAGGPVSPNAVMPFPDLIDGGQPTVGEPRPTPAPIVTAPDSVLVNEATPRRGGEAGSWNVPVPTRRPATRPHPAVEPGTQQVVPKPTRQTKPTEVAPTPTRVPTPGPTGSVTPTPEPTPTVSLDSSGGAGGGGSSDGDGGEGGGDSTTVDDESDDDPGGSGPGGTSAGDSGDGDSTGDSDGDSGSGDSDGDSGSGGTGGGAAGDDCPYPAAGDDARTVLFFVGPDSPQAGPALDLVVRLADLVRAAEPTREPGSDEQPAGNPWTVGTWSDDPGESWDDDGDTR